MTKVMQLENRSLLDLLRQASKELKPQENMGNVETVVTFVWDNKTYLLLSEATISFWGYSRSGFYQKLREYFGLNSSQVMWVNPFGTSLIHPLFLTVEHELLGLSLHCAVVFLQKVDLDDLTRGIGKVVKVKK